MDAAAGRLLMQAASSGDAEAVRAHIAAGAPVDFADATGSTALHVAVSEGLTGVVSVLLRGGANIDARTSLEGGGGTPLHLAILSGQPDIAATLIQAGADVDAEEFGEHGAWRAASCGAARRSAVQGGGMQTRGAQETGASTAHERNPVVDLPARRPRPCPRRRPAGSGKTPLILAAEHGLLSVAAELLAAGCDEERCDTDGFNAAFWAKHKRLAGWERLGGVPSARAPSMEELLLDLGQRRMAMVAVGAKLNPAKKAKGKAKKKAR